MGLILVLQKQEAALKVKEQPLSKPLKSNLYPSEI